jgi:hypothetical protein
MSSRLWCAVSLVAAACGSSNVETSARPAGACDKQWVAVVANGPA